MIKEGMGMKQFRNKTEGLFNFQDLKSPGVRIAYACMFIFLLLLSAICLFPIIWVFLSAFKTPEEMYKIPPDILPKAFDLDRVKTLMGRVNFVKYFTNTLIVIVGCWAFDIVFNGLAGYVLSRIKPKGSALLETVIFWSMLLPGISMAPLYMTFIDMPIIHINLRGSYLPLWLMAGCNAFNILLFRNFFNGIPMDYIDAARIDGCSNLNVFFKIIMPLSKPILVVVSIFSIIGSWSNFMWPYLILGSTPKEPISVLLYQITNGAGLKLMDNEVMMVTMLAIIPPLLIYALLSRHSTGGLNMSGLKG